MGNDADRYRRFLNGDDNGLREIIDIYYNGLILYIYGIVSDQSETEDIVQETFVTLATKKPKYADVLAETDGTAAYLKKRMGRNSDKEITVSDKTVSLLLHENGQRYANAFVDENHYFDVIGAVSEEEMTEFLNAFAYEKNVF